MGMRGGNTLLRKTSFDASHMMANSQTTEKAAEPISQSQRLRGGVTDAPIPTEKPIQCSVVPMVWMIVWNRMSVMEANPSRLRVLSVVRLCTARHHMVR